MSRRHEDLWVTFTVAVLACAAAALRAPVAVTAVLGLVLFAAPGYLLGQLLAGSGAGPGAAGRERRAGAVCTGHRRPAAVPGPAAAEPIQLAGPAGRGDGAGRRAAVRAAPAGPEGSCPGRPPARTGGSTLAPAAGAGCGLRPRGAGRGGCRGAGPGGCLGAALSRVHPAMAGAGRAHACPEPGRHQRRGRHHRVPAGAAAQQQGRGPLEPDPPRRAGLAPVAAPFTSNIAAHLYRRPDFGHIYREVRIGTDRTLPR